MSAPCQACCGCPRPSRVVHSWAARSDCLHGVIVCAGDISSLCGGVILDLERVIIAAVFGHLARG
eukprot:9715240-Lingulodinium_polyedra.AAC.1